MDSVVSLSGGATLSSASSSTDRSGSTITFQGPVKIKDGTLTGHADNAAFDSSTNSLSASSIRIENAAASNTYTCSSGALLEDGIRVPGDVRCLDRIRISCTGPTGDRVRMEFQVQDCRIEP